MNDPDGSAFIKGICGDTMEFYLVIEKEIITRATYYTDGCTYTNRCGEAAARFVEGRNLINAMGLSAEWIIREAGELPEDHLHCAALTAMTFLKAAGEYLYKKSIS